MPLGVIGWRISFLLGALDINQGTVHVHLSIANLVVPSPSKSVLAGGNIGVVGNGELKGGSASSVRVSSQISSSVGRASAFDGVNDHPFRRCIDLCTSSYGDLARSATVHCATSKAESLSFADMHGVDRAAANITLAFTRIVTATCFKGRAVWTVGRSGSSHNHVSIDRRGQCEHGCDRLHFEVAVIVRLDCDCEKRSEEYLRTSEDKSQKDCSCAVLEELRFGSE